MTEPAKDLLHTAMTADAAELSHCSQLIRSLADQLNVPELSQREREQFSREGYKRQGMDALFLADVLSREPELQRLCGVDPAQLFDLARRETQLLRLQVGIEQIEADAADGKLLMGALICHYDDKAQHFFEQKLAALPAQKRLGLIAELAGLCAPPIEERDAHVVPEREGQAEHGTLSAQAEEAENCIAYLHARQALAQGEQVDKKTLLAAQTHLLQRLHRGERGASIGDLAGPGKARGG